MKETKKLLNNKELAMTDIKNLPTKLDEEDIEYFETKLRNCQNRGGDCTRETIQLETLRKAIESYREYVLIT